MTIKQDRFVRVLLRCAEVAEQVGIDPAISNVYNEALAAPADAYLAADTAVSDALIACEENKSAAVKALKALNSPYKVARSSLMAILPETSKAVPDTLKVLATDTDRVKAIQWLLGELQKRAGKGWVDALISGEFGVKAAATLVALNKATVSSNNLVRAQMDLAEAHDPAHEKYIDFKKVVCDALGRNSPEYKRIHLRASAKSKGEEPDDKPAADKCATPEAASEGEAATEGAPSSSAHDTPSAAPGAAPGAAPSAAPAEPTQSATP